MIAGLLTVLIVLAFLMWRRTRSIEHHLSQIADHVSQIESELSWVVVRQVPGATRMQTITKEDGTRTIIVSAEEDEPKIVDPHGPKAR